MNLQGVETVVGYSRKSLASSFSCRNGGIMLVAMATVATEVMALPDVDVFTEYSGILGLSPQQDLGQDRQ